MVAAIAPWFCLRLLSCGLGSNPKQTIYGFFNLYCWNWNCYCSCCCIDENNDGNKRKRGPLKSLTWAKRWPEPRWWCWRWRWEVTCGRSTSCPREAWDQCHKTFQAVTNVSVTGFDKISQLWQKLNLWQFNSGFIQYLAKFWTHFAKNCYWANFHCCQWSNFGEII